MTQSDNLNLGYIIESGFTPPVWCLDVCVGHDPTGIPKIIPVAFSLDQAREIARRINEKVPAK